jgi:hypothetical protein
MNANSHEFGKGLKTNWPPKSRKKFAIIRVHSRLKLFSKTLEYCDPLDVIGVETIIAERPRDGFERLVAMSDEF